MIDYIMTYRIIAGRPDDEMGGRNHGNQVEDVKAEEGPVDPKQVPWWTSCRLQLAFFGFLGFINLYALRVNMSVAIVCMVNQTAIKQDVTELTDNGTALELDCPYQTANATVLRDGEFVWSKRLQGIILGSFFWGYLLTQILGGWLAGRFGGKRIFGYCMLATALATLLTPVGSKGSPYLLMVLQVIKGLGEGVVFPAMHSLWSHWAPPLERSKLIGFTYAGAQIGNVITMPISGILCDRGFAGGWPSIFYVSGMYGVFWFILWMVMVTDSPENHPRITSIEKRYIQENLGNIKKSQASTPWLTFARSKPIWAIIIAHKCANWGTYTLLTNIPAYMREVLKFDIKSNGLFSAIPYIVFWATISFGGILADKVRARGVATKIVRKTFYSMGTLLPAVCLVGTGYITCANPYIGVAMLALSVGFSGFQYPGVMVNHVDIAAPFAGVLFGISNTAATLPGILAPFAIGVITVDQTQQQWQIVFYITAVMYVVGAVVFNVMAEGETQDWVKPYLYDEENTTSYDGKERDEHLKESKKIGLGNGEDKSSRF